MKARHLPSIESAFRMLLAGLAVIGQLLLFLWLTNTLMGSGTFLYSVVQVIAIFTIVKLVHRHESPSYKIAWILVVFLLPVFGLILYSLWGRANHRHFLKMRNNEPGPDLWDPESTADAQLDEFSREVPLRSRIPRFLLRHGFPIYRESDSEYYPIGETCFEALYKDLEQARRFIFLEFFIVGEGYLWNRIADILCRKAREGLEVRFLIDDFGGLKLSRAQRKRLTDCGVKLRTFNPILRHVSNLYLNYRNHQKIVSIDGTIGYTGGVNLADEYINLNRKHGHWKDTAVRVSGEGVWSLTLAFLQMWHLDDRKATRIDLEWKEKRTDRTFTETDASNTTGTMATETDASNTTGNILKDMAAQHGWYLPFTDGPSNNPHNPAKGVCQQMIESAGKYVWITSPYLILEEDMLDSLCRAAESGIDVRIITPSVPDKWYVHMVTRSHYGRLIAAGVRIFEYTPGFMHAKTIVSDDDHALVGTINFDFRSFYLQYENAVWFCHSPIVAAVKADYLETLEICQEITWRQWMARPWYHKIAASVFRLFSTLM